MSAYADAGRALDENQLAQARPREARETQTAVYGLPHSAR